MNVPSPLIVPADWFVRSCANSTVPPSRSMSPEFVLPAAANSIVSPAAARTVPPALFASVAVTSPAPVTRSLLSRVPPLTEPRIPPRLTWPLFVRLVVAVSDGRMPSSTMKLLFVRLFAENEPLFSNMTAPASTVVSLLTLML